MRMLPGARPGPRARPPLSLPTLTVALALLAAEALAAPPAAGPAPSTPEAPATSGASSEPPAGTRGPAASSSLSANGLATLTPCRVDGVPTEVQCGSLRRPLDPAHPEGKQIDLRFVVVRALARNKLPDPVLLLAGGPGQSAVSLTGSVLPRLSRLNYRRDLVFVDQRGTGRSAPLQCADTSGRDLEELTQPGAKLRLLDACRVALEKLPYGDLRMFTTPIAMQDMDAVRAALGVERWNLIGASYGTRAALEYQRQFPQRVRRAVIDGVAPPDMVLPASFSRDGQAALDQVFDGCAADAACRGRYPELRAEWQGLLKSLPRKVGVTHPVTGKAEQFTLTREALLGMIRPPLYVPAAASALPAALHEAAQGRFEAVAGLAGQLGGGSRAMRLAEGMHFSVICAEDAPRLAQSTDAPSSDFGTLDRDLYANVCRAWPRGEVPPAFYTMPTAKTPVLVLSGGADPATPPRHGARVAQTLGPRAVHVVVPQAGHGVAMTLGCMRDVVYRFIDAAQDDDALRVDASCAQRIPRPTPYLPPTAATVAAAASAAAARETDR
ncbi:alpha/beta hydrolase [Roseateles chitosanitabidus]|uniref:alpha/beta hydrolase n=1 Tax=Roseateles chitosanitabidus TaxID=65048 RepID=UPI0023560387|nr:alpha/beta hydrolase [Roseateles chitosanitabidus]